MRGRSRGIMAVLAAVVSLVALPPLTGAASADTMSDEISFVARINQLRASQGLPALTVDARLTETARAWSATMARVDRLHHNPNLAAQSPFEWLRLGENVGMGPDVAALHDAFVASPDHYRNLVHPSYNGIGVGVVRSGGILWVTQVFMQGPVQPMAPAPITSGSTWYRIARASGDVHAFGTAAPHPKAPSRAPVAAVASTKSGAGYWQATTDGAVFASGDAVYHGGMPAGAIGAPIVGMAATPSGNGYWLVASDGGIFSFGDARFLGSTGAIRLNQPIVGMAATPSGNGYWLVASDGGIFAFGEGAFLGSAAGVPLGPVVGMVAGG